LLATGAIMYDELPSFGICAWAKPKDPNTTRIESKTNPMLFMIYLHFLSPEYQGKILNGL
jgi:hypothetical protein